ncbi:MAG: hypothetical protein PHQ23_01280 [Candidatus Wallbacteria bacterium]|nr:hypothetical protein [Candidatus Wallbacteria bacterium]
MHRLKLAAVLLVFLALSRASVGVDSDVLENDLRHYPPEMQVRIATKIFERRAYVYSEFGHYELARECLLMACKLAPEKKAYYEYLLVEYTGERTELDSALCGKSEESNSEKAVASQRSQLIKVKKEAS